METMTSSFPSSTYTRPQLDNIVFYSGPASPKRCASSSNADKWPDIHEILAQAAQQEWETEVEGFDFSGGFDITSDGEFRLHRLCTGPAANALDGRFAKPD